MSSTYEVAPKITLEDTETLVSIVLFVRHAGGEISLQFIGGKLFLWIASFR